MSVEDIIKEQSEMKAHTHEFALWRRKWQEFNSSIIFNWHLFKLEISERGNIPRSPGIYTLLIQPGIASHPGCSYLMYIGQARSLRDRFSELRLFRPMDRLERGNRQARPRNAP